MAGDRKTGKSRRGDDGAAKKKKRRLSTAQEVLLSSNNDAAEKASTPSRSAATPSKRKKPRRSLATSTNWEADLGEIYRNCIQLGTQNKINAKNAWNLRLLDYIDNVLDAEDTTSKQKAQASGKKSSDPLEQSICNFQLASNTLDTSVKIYACRVDAVHTDAYKVLGGLNRTEVSSRVKEALADDDHSDDEDAEARKKAQKQRKTASLASTLESNVANINSKALDMECAVDPLFHKTSAAFDEGGAKGLLLSQLGVSDGGNIVFDSTEYDAEAISEEGQDLDVAALQALISPGWEEDTVCPYFANFSFHHVPGQETGELGETPSAASMVNVVPADFPALDELSNEATFPDDAPMPDGGDAYDGGYDDSNGAFDGGDFSQPAAYDDGGDGMGEELGDREAVAGVIGEIFGTGNYVKEFDYSKVLGEGSDGFSYFNKRLMDNWAGPEHWKFRAPAASSANTAAKPKAAKKKEFFIDFFAEDETDYEELFKKPARGTTTLSAQVLNKEANNTLPPDKHYDIKMLTRLFLRPNKPIGYRRVAGGGQAEADDHDGFNDSPENWVPLDAATETFDMAGEADDNDGAGIFGWEGGDDQPAPSFGDDLIDEPEQVQHVPITFAKRAKKVDVEKLKGCIWKQLCTPADGSEAPADETGQPCTEKIEGEKPISFNNILQDLPQVVPSKQLPDVSVPMCFICLLDLANKKGLEIDQTGDSDLLISNYIPQAS